MASVTILHLFVWLQRETKNTVKNAEILGHKIDDLKDETQKMIGEMSQKTLRKVDLNVKHLEVHVLVIKIIVEDDVLLWNIITDRSARKCKTSLRYP